jgi:DNA-binding beta-propeller fold protein YncE
MVARLDRQTRAVTLAGPFPGALRIAVVASAVWIGSNELVELNADSLKLLARIALPAETTQNAPNVQLAASTNELWAAYGKHLYQLDPATGRVLQTRSIPGLATSISLSPAGGQLYVGADADPVTTDTFATITAFEATTLKQVASTRTGGGGLGGPDVAAAKDGVWVAYATGMLGQVEHRRASDLGELPVAKHQYTNGVHVYVAGGFVWEADGMAGGLGCLDPQSGILSWTNAVPFGGIVAGDSASIYLGGSSGVETLTPDPSCKSAG